MTRRFADHAPVSVAGGDRGKPLVASARQRIRPAPRRKARSPSSKSNESLR